MNELGYNLIVDKSVKRKIDILKLLLQAKRPLTIAYISQVCLVSTRTISAEIKKMNELFPTEISIMSKENEGISLITENPFRLSGFIDQLLDGNPLYFIIDSIFKNEKETIEYYSLSTYISESTIRSHLSILKRILSGYSLSLQIRPFVDITGNEIDIRFFFFNYFRQAHEGSSLIPRADQLEDLYDSFSQITYELEQPLEPLLLDYYRLTHWIIIFEQRVATGHPVTLPKEILDKYIDSPNYLRLKKIFNNNFANNTVLNSLSEEELVYVFILRLDSISYEVNTHFYTKDFEHFLPDFEPSILRFFSHNNLNPIINIDLKILLQSFLLNTMLLTELTPAFQRVSLDTKEHTKLHYADIFNQWMTILYEAVDSNLLRIVYYEDLATSLTLISVSYLQLYITGQKTILFSLTGSPSSLNYYKTVLLNMLPQSATAHFIFNKPVTEALLEALHVDAYVYNYHLEEEFPHFKAVRLSNIPTEIEWLELLPKLLFS